MAPRETREIVVRVDTPGEQGLKKMAEGFGKMNRNISEGTGVLKRFEQAYFRIAGLSFAGLGFGAIITSLDAFQKLNDKLKITEGSAEGARLALGKIVEVAGISKSSVQDISTVYSRLNQSMTELNLGSDAVLGMTLALQNSFRIYGATAAEAQGATIQLSQALSAGGLRGQELRSVMEANGLLAGFLAKKLGIARGELIKWAEKNGGISTQVVLETLSENFEYLNKAAGELTPTVGESLTLAFDKARLALHQMNQESGATAALANTILFLGDSAGTLAKAIGLVAGAFLTYKAAVYTALALNGAIQLAQGIYSLYFATQILGLPVVTKLYWDLVAAKTAHLAVLGPLGLALGVLTAAYAAYRYGVDNAYFSQEEMNKRAEKGSISLRQNGDEMMRAANAMVKHTAATRSIASETDSLTMSTGRWREEATKALGGADKYSAALADAAKNMKEMEGSTFVYAQALAKLNNEFGVNGNLKEYKERLKELDIKKLTQEFEKGEISLVKFKKELNEIMNGKAESNLKKYRGELAEVNKQFASAVAEGNVTDYARAVDSIRLEKFERDLNEGRIGFLAFNKELRSTEMIEFNRAVRDGSMGLTTYRQSLQSVQLEQINEEWKAGITDIYAYNKAIVETQNKFAPGSAFYVGTQNYISQAGTLSQNVANGVTTTFGRLEDAMVEFTTKGKFLFKDFAMAVLEDINRIIIRAMIIRPIAEGILSGIGTSAGAGAKGESSSAGYQEGYGEYAKGGAFKGGVQFFAKGGVVSKTSSFGMKNGIGVMGEKGPEAIMPLRRTASGDLGVQASSTPVVVNIHNESGGEVEQKESSGPNGERVLDIIIKSKIKETFASGSMDKQMNTLYGLRRKGN